jgi:hypothetical protein
LPGVGQASVGEYVTADLTDDRTPS